MKNSIQSLLALIVCVLIANLLSAQPADISKKLKGFDQYVEKVMNDWNAPGLAVGIVYKDQLVFAKGYGYRDLEKKLPVTSKTMFAIASNTKLFTSVAAGFLVEEGKLAWDKPIRQFDPSIEFYNAELNNNVTLRDMLSHRTGISRHDFIWYKSDFSRKELFERIKYLEPSQPLRQGYLYNNLMYMGVGYVMENISGKTWEDYVREKIFQPLRMNNSVFTLEEMEKQPDFAFPYYEQRDTTILLKRPFYRQMHGVGPCGSILSNVEDMSRWLIALMNGGRFEGKQVIPEAVLSATLKPGIALSNSALESKGYDEIINPVYGMGRTFYSYKGHYSTQHSGAIGGFYSKVSTLLYDDIGVIVFVNGSHNYPMVDIITNHLYDRLLGLEHTPWHERALKGYLDGKKAAKERRKTEGKDRVAGTQPSHSLEDYAGVYEHPAYGVLQVTHNNNQLEFEFHGIRLPLTHYHYDRFETPDDQLNGKFSVNFSLNPQGEVYTALMSLDESEAAFVRKPDTALANPETLVSYSGKYESPTGSAIEVKAVDGKGLYIVFPGQPQYQLLPHKPANFRVKEFSDMQIQFVTDRDKVTGFKIIDPSGETFVKRTM